jgi:small subunit ribosomal protein S5
VAKRVVNMAVPDKMPVKVAEVLEEGKIAAKLERKRTALDAWKPKTELGRKVKSSEVTTIDQVLDSGQRILEAEIVDALVPDLASDLLLIGQSKGKFGGGQRRAFKQTQKKTAEGNKPSFGCVAVLGDKNGHVGIGIGKSKDTVPAREKAVRKAKLNIFKIKRGCGSWECNCKTPHSIPFKVTGKSGSTKIHLLPAPKGKGLCVEEECAKILQLAGIKDCWSKSFGQTRVKTNLINACVAALKQLTLTKVNTELAQQQGMVEGSI